jgi:transcriptional regulator with XRE-family HTH domain
MKLKKTSQFKENLIYLLKDRKISLHQLSKKTNINKSTLHNYLNGVGPQGLDAMLKLTHFFDISIEELVYGKDVKATGAKKSSLRISEGQFEITIKKVE